MTVDARMASLVRVGAASIPGAASDFSMHGTTTRRWQPMSASGCTLRWTTRGDYTC